MKRILVISFILLTSGLAFAENIILKSGDKINATVIEKNDTYVKIDFKGATIIYYTSEIDSIDGKPAFTNKTIRSEKPLQGLLESGVASQGVTSAEVITPEDYMTRGIAYYGKNEFDLAVSNFDKAIKANSKYTAAYLYRGLSYMSKNDFDKAIADYDKAIEINPKNEEAYYIRGIAYASKKDIDKAIADYDKAVEINPKYVQAYLNRAFVNMMKGDYQALLADIKKVLDIDPGVASAYYIRGLSYANQNNIAQAIDDYNKAIELNPKYVEAYVNRGLAYAYKGMTEESGKNPASPTTFINISIKDLYRDDYKKAIADCDHAIEINPKYIDAYIIRARIYQLGNEFDKAWTDVHKAEGLGGNVAPEFLDKLKKASGREK